MPRLQGEVRADVCVVGLGGSGLTAVLELARRGLDVVGIDALRVGAQAAGRNGGFLLAGLADFYHDAEAELGLERARSIYRLTMDELDRIEAMTQAAVRRTGSLRIAWSDDEVEDCRRQLAVMDAASLPAQWYDGPEGIGLYIPTDGVMNPLLRCRLLASRAVAQGAHLFELTPAVRLQTGSVETPAGGVRCAHILVAVDGRLELVLPELACTVRTARLQMIGTAPAREISLPRPVYANYGFTYWQQTPDRRIALGGFRDLHMGQEWTVETGVSRPVQADLERFLREGLGVRARITHRWAGHVGYTADRRPIFAEVRPGVTAIGGYNGTGNVLGSLYARAAAEQIVSGGSGLARVLRGEEVVAAEV